MLVCGVQDSGSAYVFRRDLDALQLHTSSLIHSCMFLAQWACDRITVILSHSDLGGCSSHPKYAERQEVSSSNPICPVSTRSQHSLRRV